MCKMREINQTKISRRTNQRCSGISFNNFFFAILIFLSFRYSASFMKKKESLEFLLISYHHQRQQEHSKKYVCECVEVGLCVISWLIWTQSSFHILLYAKISLKTNNSYIFFFCGGMEAVNEFQNANMKKKSRPKQ